MRPKDGDVSSGRFLAKYDGYLDSAIYAPGREVTVAGRILGERSKLLGEIEYNYPLVMVKEVYLWPKQEKIPVYQYPYIYRDYWPENYYYQPYYYQPYYYNRRYWN